MMSIPPPVPCTAYKYSIILNVISDYNPVLFWCDWVSFCNNNNKSYFSVNPKINQLVVVIEVYYHIIILSSLWRLSIDSHLALTTRSINLESSTVIGKWSFPNLVGQLCIGFLIYHTCKGYWEITVSNGSTDRANLDIYVPS